MSEVWRVENELAPEPDRALTKDMPATDETAQEKLAILKARTEAFDAFLKSAFQPAPPPQGGPPIDPNTGQPVDPAMMQQGGQPPMDPSMQGAPPPDPSMQGAPPGGMPPEVMQQIEQMMTDMGGALQELGGAVEQLVQQHQSVMQEVSSMKQEISAIGQGLSMVEKAISQPVGMEQGMPGSPETMMPPGAMPPQGMM